MVQEPVGAGLGVPYTETAFLAALIALNVVLTWLIGRATAQLVRNETQSLNHMIAEAIQSKFEAIAQLDGEPINPIQAAIANFIQNQMNPSIQTKNVTELSRDDQGKFT